MKKKVLFIFLFLLVSSLFFVSAQNQTSQTDVSSKAYSCLDSRITDCSSLSVEEKIFAMLATGKCKTELNAESLGNECWPKSDCEIKTTAQAILALRTGTTSAENWLLTDQTMTFTGLDWYLQVESNDDTTCTADYSGTTNSFSITDKVISGNAGSCLTVSDDGYWLLISSNCYGIDIQVSCDKSFSTNLFYKKPSSATFYVSGATHSASGAGSTTERVNSLCFGDGACDYEGSLWATLVLNHKRGNISAYIPYLVAMADENQQYVPESFLYSLTNNFKISLLSKQVGNQYWELSGDRFYDTAVALLPFQNQEIPEKTNTKNWLEEVQADDGCWEGGIRNTAFILYSIWPKSIAGETPSAGTCLSSNYFCRSSISCLDDGGLVMDAYSNSCFGTDICCNKEEQLQTCDDQQGELCASSEQCLGGTEVSSLDPNSEKFCCVGGICGLQEATQCSLNNGICRTLCSDNEQLGSYTCSGSDICCVAKKTSYVWLIVLLIILIILAVVGIIYRKQLRDLFFKFKSWLQSKFGKGKGKPTIPPRPGMFPPGRLPTIPSTRVPPGAVQRRVITTTTTRPTPIKQPAKTKSDFDDVLKKLREIGK